MIYIVFVILPLLWTYTLNIFYVKCWLFHRTRNIMYISQWSTYFFFFLKYADIMHVFAYVIMSERPTKFI